jgi:hypothetical protein
LKVNLIKRGEDMDINTHKINPEYKLPEIGLENLMSCTSIVIWSENYGGAEILYASSDPYDFIEYYTNELLNYLLEHIDEGRINVDVMNRTEIIQREHIDPGRVSIKNDEE